MATVAPLPPGTSDAPFTSSQTMLAYIVARAQQLGVDPQAALAVAKQEGGALPGHVGDNGTSFGPWQLHIGGALPSSIAQRGADYANQWANSPAGVDYALGRIASVSRGQRGALAVTSIVYRFERPQNPALETQNAIAAYPSALQGWVSGGGSITGALGGAVDTVNSGLRHVPGVAQVEGAVSGTVGVVQFLGKLTDPHYILRGLQVVAGGVLVLVGTVLLARQVGLAFAQSDTGQAVINTAEKVTPAGAIRKSAGGAKRRKGNAEISRGGEVTRTGPPQRRTGRDRVQAARNARARERESQRKTAARDERYGDIPF